MNPNIILIIGFGVLFIGTLFIPQDDLVPIGEHNFGILFFVGVAIMIYSYFYSRKQRLKDNREVAQ